MKIDRFSKINNFSYLKYFLIVLSIFFFQCRTAIPSQQITIEEGYQNYIKQAEGYYKEKKYHLSGSSYNEAFIKDSLKINLNDRYNAACSWALANQPDSSFAQLFIIVTNNNYSNLNYLSSDSDFLNLRSDERWKELVSIAKLNQENKDKKLNEELIEILDSVYITDQKVRDQLDSIGNNYGWNSNLIKNQWIIIHHQDSLNLIKVESIINKNGWLGDDIIGVQGNLTLFIVIEHSKKEIQEKYLPIIREAVLKGNANAQSLAYLEDKVALNNGEKQIYGSQIGMNKENEEFYVLPLLDPDNVDERRAKVGLPPISEYLISSFEIVWDVELYKKQLPEILNYKRK